MRSLQPPAICADSILPSLPGPMKASAPSTRRSSLIIFDVVSLSLRLLVFVLCVIVICDHAGPQKTPGPLSASLVALLSVSLQFARSSHIHVSVGSLQCVHSFWHVLGRAVQCSHSSRRSLTAKLSVCVRRCKVTLLQNRKCACQACL